MPSTDEPIRTLRQLYAEDLYQEVVKDVLTSLLLLGYYPAYEAEAEAHCLARELLMDRNEASIRY